MRFPQVPVLALLVLAALAAGCARRAPKPAAAVEPVLVPVVPAELMRIARTSGRPVLLNAWASWCGPCREEFPALLAAVKRHPGVRLVLVSADFDEQLPEAKRFLAEHGVTDTTYLKRGGDQDFIDAVDSTWSGALPATLVLDRTGRPVAFWEGAADSARFETALVRALQAPNEKETRP